MYQLNYSLPYTVYYSVEILHHSNTQQARVSIFLITAYLWLNRCWSSSLAVSAHWLSDEREEERKGGSETPPPSSACAADPQPWKEEARRSLLQRHTHCLYCYLQHRNMGKIPWTFLCLVFFLGPSVKPGVSCMYRKPLWGMPITCPLQSWLGLICTQCPLY